MHKYVPSFKDNMGDPADLPETELCSTPLNKPSMIFKQRYTNVSILKRHMASMQQQQQAKQAEEEMISLVVNGRQVAVKKGKTVLDAARKAGVYIPALCYHPNLEPAGTCRLCMVDIVKNSPAKGRQLPSCATPAADGMVVLTNTPDIHTHVKDTIYLLRQKHPDKCQTCIAHKNCEFQDLIEKYDVPKPPFVVPRVNPSLEEKGVAHASDKSSPALDLDFEMCVLCLRCVRACSELQGMNILGTVARGADEVVAPVYSLKLDETECISCGACVASCPVSAIVEKDGVEAVEELLVNNIDYDRLKKIEVDGENPAGEIDLRKYITVVQTAPSVRVTLSEAFGFPPGRVSTGQLVASLKALGFDYVFDTNFGADLTIMEEAAELMARVSKGGPFPMFTSCCPAWVNLVEKVYPEFIPNLSSCKSPQNMFASIAKSYFAKKIGRHPSEIKLVSMMPCVAKKDEASRTELMVDGAGVPEVDYVLTTRELARLIKRARPKIHFGALEDQPFDNPLGDASGAGVLFGATGGVMEAALRTAHAWTAPKGSSAMPRINFEEVRGLQGIRTATIDLHGTKLNVAVANQGSNLRQLLDNMKAGRAPPLHFVEMMACRGGCVGGAGNPKDAVETELLQKRVAAIYSDDAAKTVRSSHENPDIKRLYSEFLGEPNSHLAHKLLHTHFTDRHPKQRDIENGQKTKEKKACSGGEGPCTCKH